MALGISVVPELLYGTSTSTQLLVGSGKTGGTIFTSPAFVILRAAGAPGPTAEVLRICTPVQLLQVPVPRTSISARLPRLSNYPRTASKALILQKLEERRYRLGGPSHDRYPTEAQGEEGR